MTMINPETGWFGIVKIPKFNIDEVMDGNFEYIDKSSIGLVIFLIIHG